MFDYLTDELAILQQALDEAGVEFLLAGGMGLYLRDISLDLAGRSPRYPKRPISRTTSDLDVMLTVEVIVSAPQMEALKGVLRDMEYRSIAKHYQFARKVADDIEVKVDLLAPKPVDERRQVKINGPRIRPHHVSGIHARVTEEAQGISKFPVSLEFRSGVSVNIPSAMNYVILKLHAFEDRKDSPDEKSDNGRHHALDVFRVVTDMREEDWEAAIQHVQDDNDQDYLQRAANLQRLNFGTPTSPGILRLREHPSFQSDPEFSTYVPQFIQDLSELFAACSVLQD